MNVRTLFLVACLIATTMFAGCASKSSSAPMTASVDEKDFKFAPATVTIKKGGSVTWTNLDSAPHDVTATDASWKSGDAGNMTTGATYTKMFDAAGTFAYYCTLHGTSAGAGMAGKVVVVA